MSDQKDGQRPDPEVGICGEESKEAGMSGADMRGVEDR